MDPLISVALAVAPEIGVWLFGEGTEDVVSAVSRSVVSVTGMSDPQAASSVLQQNASASAQLRLRLNQIAAERAKAARGDEVERVTSTVRDAIATVGATAPTLAGRISAPAIISTVVLLVFGATSSLVMLHGLPAGSETASNMLLGTIAAMATSVVSYWVGSSAGSARKDERLSRLGQ
jgi:hypothetical protein